MIEHLLSIGKTPMGWEELLFTTQAAADYPMAIVDAWHRTSWVQAAALGHKTIVSNNHYLYLDAHDFYHSAVRMWMNLTAICDPELPLAPCDPTPAQAKLLLGGETSMWQGAETHSCLFDNSKDAAFARSAAGCIWPRAAIAAGSFWGFYNNTKTLDAATLNATQQRLVARGVDSCPCATLNSTSCNQTSRCGVAYCPPTPAPPTPAPPTPPTPPPPTPPTPPTPAPAACGSAAPWLCLFAVPCDASDPDQAITFEDGQLRSASGLCADAVGCKQVNTLALAPCDTSSKTQQWTHNATGADKFASVGCADRCIDCYNGGKGNAGLYHCSGGRSPQDWVATGKTFSEDYLQPLKCMSQAPPKP